MPINMSKRNLLLLIDHLMKEHEGEKDFLSKVANRLNERGVTTLTGREWTPRNLWAFKSINSRALSKLPPSFDSSNALFIDPPFVITPDQKIAHVIRSMEGDAPGWSTSSLAKRYGWIPVAIGDSSLLEQAEQRLEGEDRSLSQLIEDLLWEWLENQKETNQESEEVVAEQK